MEEEKVIGGKNYLLGHTTDYVRVALPLAAYGAKPGDGVTTEGKPGAGTNAPEAAGKNARAGEILKLELLEFLTEDILLGRETDLF